MIETLVLFLQTHILPWGVVGVFVASVAEEVVAPIPSALIMTMSGFLFVSGKVSLSSIGALVFKVAIPAALGVTIGSYAVYFVARWGGKAIIERWGKYLGLYWRDVEKMQNRLSGSKKDDFLIMLARVLPFVPSVAISAFCGILNISASKYFVISFFGVFFRALILGGIGWQVGNVYIKYASIFGKLEQWILGLLGLSILLYLLYRNFSRNK